MKEEVLEDWKQERRAFLDLLAVIFRDGGHTTSRIGSLIDAAGLAKQRVVYLRCCEDALRGDNSVETEPWREG